MTSKFAIVIANMEYQDRSFAKLTAPGKDAEEFAQILRDRELAAFDEVQVLVNEVEAQTRRAIARFFAERKPADLLLLYFSGHGVRNDQGQLFLAAQDTEMRLLDATGIPAEFITRAMNASRSQRQLLILDCCNSGAFAHGSKSASAVGGSMGIATAFEGNGYGRIVLTATDATQFAWEGDEVIGDTQKSVFTHFLIEGLKGVADRDRDGRITVDELYDYAYEQVVRRTPKQTPGKWSYRQQGDIILRDNLNLDSVKPEVLKSNFESAETPKRKTRFAFSSWMGTVWKSNLPVRVALFATGVMFALWGGATLIKNRDTGVTTSTPTHISQSQSTDSISPSETFIPLTPAPSDVRTMMGKDGMVLVHVAAGDFMMGSNDHLNETPPHSVSLDDFWIDQTEVTNAMYAQCVKDRQCDPPRLTASVTRDTYYGNSEFDNYPVIHVSWDAAKKYCAWADRRLPTEAEWEKAARGEHGFTYPWGNPTPDSKFLNFNKDLGDTTEVGTYPEGASPYNALDMAGNVWEWVADWYGEAYYSDSPRSNPLGPASGQERVHRGGTWSSAFSEIRSTYRKHASPMTTTAGLGFRCASSP